MIFFKKNIESSKVMNGIIDCHSHILPGVDDGVKSLKKSCEVLSYLESLGVQRVILTPHIMEEYPLNSVDFLKKRFDSLHDFYRGNIDLELAGEYMLDSGFDNKLDSRVLLPLFGDHLLVETSYVNSPINFYERINKIQSKGYYVILAHPERYNYMDIRDYEKLKQNQVKFQLNILSLVGAYGDEVQQKSIKMLKEDCYEFIGSDIHNLQSFEKWTQTAQLSSSIIKKINQLKSSQKKY